MPSNIHRELAGKIAVVTGASSGIGRAIALELAAGGAKVLVHAGQRRAAVEQVAEQIRGGGSDSIVALADFTDPQSLGEFVEFAWSWQGGIDIWVNNAGADVLTGDAAGWSFDEKLDRLWQIDALGTIRLSRMIGARMKQRSGPAPNGCLLNIGWDQAEHGMAGDSGEMFAAIKGAIAAFTRSLAQSLAPQVRVNCLAPGWIRTAWGQQAPEYWQQRAQEESLLQRWGTADDVARTVRFLVSPAAEFINGQVIALNGGRQR
jgi:3-oxoacyl-[acyl-carrier protein] reductase